MSTEAPKPVDLTENQWALSREVEAAHAKDVADRDDKFNGLLEGFKKFGDDLAKGRDHLFGQFNKKAEEQAQEQHERVKSLDTPDEVPVDNRPTPAELWGSLKSWASRTSKGIGEYFDLTYRRISQDQALTELREHLLVARLGGDPGVGVILGGRSIEKKEDGKSYYADPFSIERNGDLWVVNRQERSIFARNLDEAVKAVIRSYVRDDEDSNGEHANARTSLEGSGPVPG